MPSGQYLIRPEHIALHSASAFQGAQFYMACGQINVTGGGSGTPGPLVSIPGVYTGRVSGIFFLWKLFRQLIFVELNLGARNYDQYLLP